jgi:hypothetical protein
MRDGHVRAGEHHLYLRIVLDGECGGRKIASRQRLFEKDISPTPRRRWRMRRVKASDAAGLYPGEQGSKPGFRTRSTRPGGVFCEGTTGVSRSLISSGR